MYCYTHNCIQYLFNHFGGNNLFAVSSIQVSTILTQRKQQEASMVRISKKGVLKTAGTSISGHRVQFGILGVVALVGTFCFAHLLLQRVDRPEVRPDSSFLTMLLSCCLFPNSRWLLFHLAFCRIVCWQMLIPQPTW